MTKQSEDKASESKHWMDEAKCKGWDFKKNGDPFFPVSADEKAAAEAIAICAGCPVMDACQDYSMGKDITRNHGVFGGTIPKTRISHERRASRMRRQAKEAQGQEESS